MIYGRYIESDYKRGYYGTCKVDRIGYDASPDPVYLGPNFINLWDRHPLAYREQRFVQVNTLVNN